MYYWERARTESRGRTLGRVVACAVESEETHLSQNERGSRVESSEEEGAALPVHMAHLYRLQTLPLLPLDTT